VVAERLLAELQSPLVATVAEMLRKAAAHPEAGEPAVAAARAAVTGLSTDEQIVRALGP
jgi:hypothetical protein